jgi:hypothetical protein
LSDLERQLSRVRLKENLKRVMIAAAIGIPLACLLTIDLLSKILFSPTTGYYISAAGSLAAGSITFSSIVTSLFLRDEARKIYLRRTYLKNCLLRLSDWRKKRESSTILARIYDESEEKWTEELVKIHPITNATLIVDFLPFIFFAISIFLWLLYSATSLYAAFFASLTMFYAALAVFIWAIYAHIHNLKQVESITVAPEGEGELWIQKIGEESFEKGMKALTHKVTNTKKVEVVVSFEGKITNGYFECLLVGEKNFKQWLPDESTYFADYSYPDGLKLTADPTFSLGVIQGKRSFENTTITLNIPLELELFLLPRSSLNFCKDYRITEKVTEIEIGIYEDPIHLSNSQNEKAKLGLADSNAERHCLGLVTVKIDWNIGNSNAKYVSINA